MNCGPPGPSMFHRHGASRSASNEISSPCLAMMTRFPRNKSRRPAIPAVMSRRKNFRDCRKLNQQASSRRGRGETATHATERFGSKFARPLLRGRLGRTEFRLADFKPVASAYPPFAKCRMLRDPFYQHIVEGLNRQVDPETFERCAGALLRKIYPGLAPIRGGSDAGMDGAIADSQGIAFPLICTTGKNVLGNLKRSITSYLQNGGPRRNAILATSQALTPKRRRNLEQEASHLGFALVQVYDQAAIADLLYNSPDWCLELLALTGKPRGLSMLPLTNRPIASCGLVGREEDLQWLNSSAGDVVLIGQPGAGKTYLLLAFAKENAGLFVVSNDRGEIAADLRSERPRYVIVDDAHSRLGLLTSLRQIRDELRAEFRIIASSWPGGKAHVEHALMASDASAHELCLLTRDQVVEVIKGSGIYGPNALIQEIVEQALGRPGLAITLCHLCLAGGVREVALGDAVSRDLRSFFDPLVGPKAMLVLAILSLGGNYGMNLATVAPHIGIPLADLQIVVDQLASGGVITEFDNQWLAVRPEALRHALVRDTFFNSPCCLPFDSLLQMVPNPDECTMTLIGARARGGLVTDALLKRRVQSTRSPDVWQMFAGLGADEATWIIENHPDQLQSAGRAALLRSPEVAVPRLLSQARAAELERGRTLEHDLRLIEDWIKTGVPGTGDGVQRRETLFKSATNWLASGGDASIAFAALGIALSPDFSDTEPVPGSGHSFVMRSGFLIPTELDEIRAFWPTVLMLMKDYPAATRRPIQDMIERWAYPARSRASLTQDFAGELRSVAVAMLRDFSRIPHDRLGALHWAKQTALNIGAKVDVELDAEFEALFPVNDAQHWQKSQQEQREVATRLSERWSTEDPKSVAVRLRRFEQEANAAKINWPRWSPFVASRIADGVINPIAWFSALFDAHVPADLIAPFLSRTIHESHPRGVEMLEACLNEPAFRRLAVSFVLRMASPPSSLLDRVLQYVEGMDDIVRIGCFSGEIPEQHVLELLRHPARNVAEAAALGEWQAAPPQSVRESLKEAWREAMLRASEIHFDAERIFATDPLFAFEWLKNRIQNDQTGAWRHGPAIGAALKSLRVEQRMELVSFLPEDGRMKDVTERLVDRDVEVYRSLLANASLKRSHLYPLNAKPNDVWVEFAIAALDVGYSEKDIIGATINYGIWRGKESDMWGEWALAFEILLSHGDPRVARLGRDGRATALERRERAIARERIDDGYAR